uniref:Uncharacterized protein n=1 Tax=Arundo donax TaxID=35708 RepID=A0A0A9AWW4_ARUDO
MFHVQVAFCINPWNRIDDDGHGTRAARIEAKDLMMLFLGRCARSV